MTRIEKAKKVKLRCDFSILIFYKLNSMNMFCESL